MYPCRWLSEALLNSRVHCDLSVEVNVFKLCIQAV